MARAARRPPAASRLARWLAAAALVGICGESAARVLGLAPPPPARLEGALTRPSGDALLGSEPGPGAEATVGPVRAPGGGRRTVAFAFDDAGRRAPAPGPAAAGRRVACVGDERTLGLGVAPDEAWPARLARTGGDAPRAAFATGAPGWSSAQLAHWVERRVLRASPPPALVLLAVCVDDAAAEGALPDEPLFSAAPEPGGRGAGPSRLVEWAVDSLSRRGALRARATRRAAELAEGRARVERAVLRARDAAAAAGVELGVVLCPDPVRVDGALGGAAELSRLAAWCAEAGVPCLDLAPVLDDAPPGSLRAAPGSTLYSAWAHARIARAVGAWLDAGLQAPR